jgi:hypothetical protein
MINEEIARFFNNIRAFIKGEPDLREVKFTVKSCGKRTKAGIPGTGAVLYNHALKQKDLLPEWADIALTMSFF